MAPNALHGSSTLPPALARVPSFNPPSFSVPYTSLSNDPPRQEDLGIFDNREELENEKQREIEREVAEGFEVNLFGKFGRR